jgi:predicted permease
MNDLRFALRGLGKSPGFTSLAVFTLALGIGMNTAIFSLIHDLFLRGLPFTEPSRIVRISGSFSVPRFWHYRDNQSCFTEMAADAREGRTGFTITSLGDPLRVNGAYVTANYFRLLGVQPILGRLFLPEEESKADAALISENFWRSKLGSDPAVLGRALILDGVPTTVVGVMPNMPIAWFGPGLAIWNVKPFDPPFVPKEALNRGYTYMRAIARLKPGVTVEQARAALQAVQESYRRQNGEKPDADWEPVVITASDDVTVNLRPAFLTLLAAVSFVLLIACSNVANLLLVRFTGRRREIAVRAAIGASRWEIVRLFVLESTLLSVLAGVIGLGIAAWAMPVLPALAGDKIPLETATAIHWPVLFFTLSLSILTGIAMGAYPAIESSRTDLVEALKQTSRSMGGSAGQYRVRRLLVAAQVGLSVILLAGATLLIASFFRLSREETGFRTEHIWTGGIPLPPARYPDDLARAQFSERFRTELQNTPGIEAVALIDALPLSARLTRAPYTRTDREQPPISQRPGGTLQTVSPGFLRLLGIPLLAGRDLDGRDTPDRPLVLLISHSAAKRLFPGEDPIGHRLFFGIRNGTGRLAEVVGVVGDIRSERLDTIDEVKIYGVWAQLNNPFVNIMVRSQLGPAAAGQAVRGVLNKLDKELAVVQPRTMDQIASRSLGQQRLITTLLCVFAGVALVLAMTGIYGAVAYTVQQRTGEIGVRMALGAQARDVFRLVASQGMKPVCIGLVVGLATTFALSRLIAAQLYNVSAQSPTLLGAATFFLAVVALVACLLPARRATKVDPMIALRTE